MSIQKKLVKKLGILFLMLIMTVTVLSATVASAIVAFKDFIFDIPANGGLCHTTSYYKRDTSSVQDAWGVNYQYANESTLVRTKTRFWLGIDNPNGTNPMGSEKYTLKEDPNTYCYLTAYAAASNKNVYLYASDNSKSNKLYSASGKWSPNCGVKPTQ